MKDLVFLKFFTLRVLEYDIIREMQIGLFLCDTTKIPLVTSQPKVQRQKSLQRQGFLLSRYIAILLRILKTLNKNTPIIKYKLIYYTFRRHPG